MNISKEDFRLRVFLTLAQEGSFTRTAAVLGKTQPAISASLSELEKIYGLKLVERGKSGNSLTPPEVPACRNWKGFTGSNSSIGLRAGTNSL